MRRIWTIGLVALFFTACEAYYKSSIPNVRFRFHCDLRQAEYMFLSTPGQFLKKTRNANGIPVGYGGLIIGQSVYSEGYTFVAYDAACPVEVDQRVTVDIVDEGLQKAVCPKCGTIYDLNNGAYPVNRKGGEYLKPYRVHVVFDSLGKPVELDVQN